VGAIKQERIFFTVRLSVCVNRNVLVSRILAAALKRDRMIVAFGLV
jgi:hypothetical protein